MIFGGVALCSGETERNARTMGMVLSFVPRTAATNRTSQNTGTPAAVIIFPGVRYERSRVTDARPGGPDKPGSPRNTPVPHH
ncbi:hypothetical protein GA829_27510 [Mesorhizobium sp. INR15]|nr:hypothetical protein GA829_27510 [Mesorhizobium sp. INR15]